MTKKAVIKRAADVLEKLGVAGLALGIFKGEPAGLFIGLGCLVVSFGLTVWESKL